MDSKYRTAQTVSGADDEDDCSRALASALKILSRRDHGEQELRNKLFMKSFSRAAITFALNECRRLNLVNDLRFAESYVEELQTKGCGSHKIRAKLRQKGIASDIIARVSAQMPDDPQRAAEIFAGKMRTLGRESDPAKRRARIFRFMMARGFAAELIGELIAQYERGVRS